MREQVDPVKMGPFLLDTSDEKTRVLSPQTTSGFQLHTNFRPNPDLEMVECQKG